MKCEDCKGVKKEATRTVSIPELGITANLCELHTRVLIDFLKNKTSLSKRYKYTVSPPIKTRIELERVVFT